MSITMLTKYLLATATSCVVLSFAVTAATAQEVVESHDSAGLEHLSLADLLEISVVTPSKKPTRQMNTPNAIYVVTREEIRRSGARTIPDILRTVPGVHVAMVDSGVSAVTIRGFNQEFANKLLVLVDGRSVYSPLFSGVLWMEQSLMLEDIDRIEVIRGSGAAVWGANAVNGVINIITRPTDETRGGLLSAGAGNVERAFGNVRYGERLGTNGHYRIWAGAFDRAGLNAVEPRPLVPADDWQSIQAGFRMDYALSARDSLMLSGGVVEQTLVRNIPEFSPTAPTMRPIADKWTNTGLHLLGLWTRELNAAQTLSIQSYIDYNERENTLLPADQALFDIDVNWHALFGQRHDIIAGASYRYFDVSTGSDFTMRSSRPEYDEDLFSAFAQYDLTVIDERFNAIIGAKAEHFQSVGWEVQPTARLIYTPSVHHSLWGGVSRAVRVPSIVDRFMRRVNRPLSPLASHPDLPHFLVSESGEEIQPEETIAYEAGYRTQPRSDLFFDATVFLNDYDSIKAHITSETSLVDDPSPHVVTLREARYDALDGIGYGGEMFVLWEAMRNWRLQSGYSLLLLELQGIEDGDAASEAWFRENAAPRHQFSLRSLWNPTGSTDLDVTFRYVDGFVAHNIDSYWQCDLRVAWRIRPDLELSIVGQNLIATHAEYGNVELAPSAYGRIEWLF
jgi:iron complex outermembrane receptor protein